MAEYAVDAINCGWNATALYDAFYWGLASEIKDELTTQELPVDLDNLITLATRIDCRIWEQKGQPDDSGDPNPEPLPLDPCLLQPLLSPQPGAHFMPKPWKLAIITYHLPRRTGVGPQDNACIVESLDTFLLPAQQKVKLITEGRASRESIVHCPSKPSL